MRNINHWRLNISLFQYEAKHCFPLRSGNDAERIETRSDFFFFSTKSLWCFCHGITWLAMLFPRCTYVPPLRTLYKHYSCIQSQEDKMSSLKSTHLWTRMTTFTQPVAKTFDDTRSWNISWAIPSFFTVLLNRYENHVEFSRKRQRGNGFWCQA